MRAKQARRPQACATHPKAEPGWSGAPPSAVAFPLPMTLGLRAEGQAHEETRESGGAYLGTEVWLRMTPLRTPQSRMRCLGDIQACGDSLEEGQKKFPLGVVESCQ
jgi:hypothetical protein